MKRMGVLTSGGDAPGMNAAIAAVVREACHQSIEVVGIKYGYRGILTGEMRPLKMEDVFHSVKHGGTMLYSARYPDFREHDVQVEAGQILKSAGIEGLVVIGGDGTFQGAYALSQQGISVIGIPGTIDNDIPGTEYTIGFDSALNTAVEAIDKISDTAASHNRTFIVEVMGNTAGDIAIWAGLATGAEAVVVPEKCYSMQEVVAQVVNSKAAGKDYGLIILSEGVARVESFVADYRARVPNEEVRGVTLSHIQRGGSPSGRDRVFATMMGTRAVQLLAQGQSDLYLGLRNDRLVYMNMMASIKRTEFSVFEEMYDLYWDIHDLNSQGKCDFINS